MKLLTDLELLEGVENLIKELHQKGMQLILASSALKLLLSEFWTFSVTYIHTYC
jgi:beta-phosphoglucomutase-like phosphatase (HAD superfamily)